jgi:hypothetical protein
LGAALAGAEDGELSRSDEAEEYLGADFLVASAREAASELGEPDGLDSDGDFCDRGPDRLELLSRLLPERFGMAQPLPGFDLHDKTKAARRQGRALEPGRWVL